MSTDELLGMSMFVFGCFAKLLVVEELYTDGTSLMTGQTSPGDFQGDYYGEGTRGTYYDDLYPEELTTNDGEFYRNSSLMVNVIGTHHL